MKKVLLSIPVIFSLIIFSYEIVYANNKKLEGYNLGKPDASFILPDTLREISGITNIDLSSFACIQDENGIIFIYDIVKKRIKKEYPFNIDGDYEGITRVNNTIYVLRSDGTLFQISDYKSKKFKLTSYITGIPANNNEGLCYDKHNNRLLIACKGKMGKGPEYKDSREIYAFNLKTKMLTKYPVFDFDLQAIKQFALDNKIDLPARIKKRGQIIDPIIKFRTSDISIHPLTKELYLLSASDYLLFVFNMKGNIQHIEQLDSIMFNKAEGITFFDNGDMLITNEGQNKKPTLFQFNYRKR